MAEVRIQSVESQITLTDSDALLTPELINRITRLVSQRLSTETRLQRELDQERKLSDGAAG